MRNIPLETRQEVVFLDQRREMQAKLQGGGFDAPDEAILAEVRAMLGSDDG